MKTMNIEDINAELALLTRKSTLAQAVRIVLSYLRTFYPEESAETLYDRLVFKANHSLAFQKSEMAKLLFVKENEGLKVELTLNFLGIFGSSSPLPTHYSEEVLQSYDDDRVLYDFLNLFNHHLEKFVYQVWQRQRYYIQYQHDLQDKFSKYMFSLIGMHDECKQKESPLELRRLLPFLGILSMRQKSVGTLVSILRHYLDHEDIEVEQGVVTKASIPEWQQTSLGIDNISLGKDFIVGDHVKTKSGKIRIIINNITKELLYDYSIHGQKMTELDALMKLALREPIEYEVMVTLASQEVEPLMFSTHYLGVNSWLGVTNGQKKIVIRN